MVYTQPIDYIFMVLYRLRCDALKKDIANGASKNNKYMDEFLYHTLKQLQCERCNAQLCQYPDTRVFLDSTELIIEMPSSIHAMS